MEPIPPSAIPPQPPKKKSFTWLIILIILLLLASTGVLAYQYYQLKTQIANLIHSPSLTSTPIPLISLQPSPKAADTITWKTYTDTKYNFFFKYPTSYTIDIDSSTSRIYLNKNIEIRIDDISSLNCKGDCPLTENSTDVQLNGYQAKKLEGYIGEIGGNIPQRFIVYEIKLNDKYLIFNLQATPVKMTKEDFAKYYALGKIIEIDQNDKAIFDQILSTFKFTN